VLEPDTRLNEARVQPQRREAHMNPASELPHLEKFSKS